MKTTEYLFKPLCSLRLWLPTMMLIVMHVFVQAQTTVEVTFDNPTQSPGGIGGNPAANASWSLTLPPGSTNIIGQAYGAGGSAGGTGAGTAGGGGGGGYINHSFGNGSGTISGQVGGGGVKPATGRNNGNAGGQSNITFGNTTIIAYGGGGGEGRNLLGGGSPGSGGTTSQNAGSTYYNGNSGAAGGDGAGGGAGGNSGGRNVNLGGNDGLGGPYYPGGLFNQSNGYNGYNPGGGSGSGYGTGYTGGNGGGGRVVISFTLPKPVITPLTSTTLCIGASLTLTVSDATYDASSNTSYTWYHNGTQVGTGRTYTVTNATVAHSGNYTVRADYTISTTGSIVPSFSGTNNNNNTATVTSDIVFVSINSQLAFTSDLLGYVQPNGTPHLDLSDYLNLTMTPSEHLEWYNTEQDADNMINETGEPPALDPTQITDRMYWVVKVDISGCRSLPTPLHIRLIPMPEIQITPDTLICPGEPVIVSVHIRNGTAPYNFKITNMNSEISDIVSAHPSDTYTFIADPMTTRIYHITEFSDATTPLITYFPYGLHTPASGYFDEITLKVTGITGVDPAYGPTTGGTYTTDPGNPIDPTGTVTIRGNGFAPSGTPVVSQITFGGIAATNITVINDSTITCTPPAHVSGPVTVSVTTDCVTVDHMNGYFYEPINIAGVHPAYGPVTGGTSVTIQGTGLLTAPGSEHLVSVTLAGTPAQIVSVSNTEIQCIAGPSNLSLLDKIVINNGSETREFNDFWTYYPVVFTVNGNWSEPDKWETHTSDQILPYPNAKIQIKANCIQDIDVTMDSITVFPSKSYTLSTGKTLAANVFTLKDDASFLPNGGNMSAVRQNVEHTLTKGRNWYISNPGGDIITISDRIEGYDESMHAWMSAGGFLDTGRGYTIYDGNTDMTVTFSGTYHNGDQQTAFTLTRQNDGNPKRGFNLVGNPFPSYWQWTSEAARQANIYSTIWYRTLAGGIYEFWSYNASGNVAVAPGWEDMTQTGSHSLAYIPPMQAFWVRVLDGQSTGVLTFTNSNRSHADHNSNTLKSANSKNTETRPLLRLVASGDASTDETVIYAATEAKKSFDTYDSDKWITNQGVEIFTLPVASTRELVINGLPEITDGTEIPLGFQTNENGAFRFHAKEILNIDTLDVFLFDTWHNTAFNLRNGDYHFTANSTPVTDRFSIIFRRAEDKSSSVTEVNGDNLLAYAGENGQIIVTLYLPDQPGSEATISVFDITGRKYAEQSVITGERTVLDSLFPEGVYVLRTGKYVTKVIVNR